MTAESTASSPEPLARLRDYELLSRLGQGGMGAVYLARHSHLDKQVAIKLLPREHLRNPEMVARFKREMKAVGKLHHPNIIQAFDGGEEKGVHFLVLEYAEGLDLNVLLSRYGKLPISDACEIIRQAAVGLEHAHLHGLVHRDIKPANILLAWPSRRAAASATDSDESDDAVTDEPRETVEWSGSDARSGLDMQPVAKVLDLGLASLNGDQQQSLGQGITGTGQIMGTLDYMAPEQTSDTHTVDIRADIYSLGCTLYALLAGRPPFHGEQYSNAYQKIVAHNQHSPRPLHEIRNNVPPAVVAILNKMLAKRPDNRYATPIEVATALAPYCHGNTLLSTLVEAEARVAEHKARSDAATQELNSSALQGTATGAAADHRYSISVDDELLELLRAKPIDETIVTQPAKLPETQFQLNVEPTRAVKQVRQVRAQDSRRLRLQVITAVTCALLGVVIAAVVFRILTNYGTIEMTLYHKDAQVTVDGDTVRLLPTGDGDQYTIRVAPGQRKLQVEKDGYTTFARDLEIVKGETKLVGVQLLREGSPEASVKRQESKMSTTPALDNRPSTLDSLEPPPLEEWLVGREILTVKQDGSAMFTKIQDALDALKPGQVVEVLDIGPYIEEMKIANQTNVGLISRCGTRLGNTDVRVLHGETLLMVRDSKQIRISGFAITAATPQTSHLVSFLQSEETFMSNCIVLQIPDSDIDTEGFAVVYSTGRPAIRHQIRHCWLEGSLALQGDRLALVESVIRRPWIATGNSHQFAVSGKLTDLVMLRSVIDCERSSGINFRAIGPEARLWLVNNTIHRGYDGQNVLQVSVPTTGVCFLGNILSAIRVQYESAPRFEWDLRANCVLPMSVNGTSGLIQFPAANNLTVTPAMLASDPYDGNYMRIPADCPLATAGLGGDYPSYIGALPPGPAPPEGDWFTRLQERWKEARADLERMGLAEEEASAGDKEMGRQGATSSPPLPLSPSPPLLPDPPPLDEWLQGREILTVKQDGTAMFTKIQDALDKAKPGQVVKILDRGPYRERLTKENFPDGGLISESSTIIEPSDYEQGELNSEPYLLAHRFQSSTGLRIAGIDFLFRESVQTRGVHSNSAITVEGCRFRFEKSPAKAENTGLFFGATGPAGWEVAAAIRDCEFRGGGLYSFNHDPQNPAQVIVVRSNLFSGDGSRAGRGIALSSSHKAFVCEQNVFTAGGQHCIVVASYGQPADGSRIRIANNLFMNARQSVVAAYWSAFAGVTFNRNLISGVSFYAADRAGQETEPFRDWRVSNNWFVSTEDEWTKGFLAADPSNRTGSLNFLSTDPSHRDYLRLPAASPAAQSDYLGPFPPGPAPPEGDWFTRLQERWK